MNSVCLSGQMVHCLAVCLAGCRFCRMDGWVVVYQFPNCHKCTKISMQFLYVIEVYYKHFAIEMKGILFIVLAQVHPKIICFITVYGRTHFQCVLTMLQYLKHIKFDINHNRINHSRMQDSYYGKWRMKEKSSFMQFDDVIMLHT